MNRVFINVKRNDGVVYEGKVDHSVVVSDNYVEDIEFHALASADFLSRPSDEVVKTLMEKDGEAADVIQAAILNGTDIYLNDDLVPHDGFAEQRTRGL